MTAYTIVGTGEINASVSTNYSPNGIPTATDTVTFAANQRLVVPSGFTFDAIVTPAAGSSAANRSGFIIEGGGTRILRGDETWAAYNTHTFRNSGTATLDLNGFDLMFSAQSGTNLNNQITTDGTAYVRLISSGALSYISTTTFTSSYGHINLRNAYVENVSLLFGGSYYNNGGHEWYEKVVFYNAGRWEQSLYSHRNADYVIDRVIYAGTCQNPTFETPFNKIINLRAQNGEVSGVTGTNRYINDLVVMSSGVSTPLFRMSQCPSNITVSGVYLNSFPQIDSNDTDWANVFFYNTNVGSLGATRSWNSCYVAMNINNPHTAENAVRFNGSVLESLYGSTLSQNDGADHFMSGSATANKYVTNSLIIDTYGGALLNTVGTSGGATGTWLLEKCTYVIDCRDAVYGQLIRNENSGYFAAGASVTVQSNILHARSNPSGATSIRACNMESGAATGQIDTLRNNCLSIPAADLSQVYFRCNAGTNDLFVNPNFVDQTRGLLTWGAQYGYANYAATCEGLMYGVIGYNPTTKVLDDGLVTGRTVQTLIDWVSYGFRPTNAALATAGHDGGVIGAMPYLAASVVLDAISSNLRSTETRTARITVPSTIPTTGNTTLKINSAGNAAITPTSCTLVSGLTYDVAFIVPDTYAGLPYSATGYPVIIATADGSVTSGNVPYLPVTGYNYVITTAVPGDLTVLSGALAVGDQVSWDTLDGTVAIDSSCVITYTGSNPDGISFNARAWDDSDDTWGDYALQTFSVSAVSPTMPADTSVNVAENSTAVSTFAASSGTAPITYSLSGADAGLFSINSSTGLVAFLSAPNFEVGSTVKNITVTATNAQGSDSQNIVVNVTNVVEAPVMPVDNTYIVYVGGFAVGNPSATFVDGTTTYAKSGTDQALFNINSSTGALSFVSAATAGSYSVTVTATNSAGSSAQNVTVSVVVNSGSNLPRHIANYGCAKYSTIH